MVNVYEALKKYKRISIIGMEKNVGKTTVLNFLIDKVGTKNILGITSIGRDGEDTDVVTSTSKPRIYIYPNTIIATARDCLRNCDITGEILYTTDFSTPMGNIVIVRAISAGYIDIAGPSYNSQIKDILSIMENFGVEISIVDGALSRKGSAVSDVTNATILSTGAALSLDMGHVIDETKTTVFLLNLPGLENDLLRERIEECFKTSRFAILYENGDIKRLENTTSLEATDEIKSCLGQDLKAIAIRGAVTQKFLETLVKNRQNFDKLELIIKDGTRVFADFITLKKIEACKIKIKVLYPINLLFITCNPRSPLGYEFPKQKFKQLLEENIKVDVIDVLGEEE